MKRIISLLLIFALAAIALISCVPANHEHAYSAEWSSDSDYHWHACTAVADCSEKGEKAAHDYDIAVDEEGKLINKCLVCGYSNEKVNTAPEHEHVFGEEYSKSENFHWHECTVEGCFEADKSDEHQYGNPEIESTGESITMKYTCVDCAYVKTETKKIESAVSDAVEWDNIFENFNLTNFSMYVYFGPKENPYQINHCVVTENGIYYHIPGEGGKEFYVLKNEDGKYEGYARQGNGFVKMPEEMCEPYFMNATRETVIRVTFAENFDKFTYNAETGTYYAEEKIPAVFYNFEGEEQGTMYCYNSEVKVADGKIISISSDYEIDMFFDDETETPDNNDNTTGNDGTNTGDDGIKAINDTKIEQSFIYYNIGMSEVKIPQSVIDQATAAPAN